MMRGARRFTVLSRSRSRWFAGSPRANLENPVSYWKAPPRRESSISINICFPQLYELWNHDSNVKIPRTGQGDFRFAGAYWVDGNVQRRDDFSEILGYGWRLGDWCTAAKVETSIGDDTHRESSAIVGKTMFDNTPYPATNPEDHFDFEVSVLPGVYEVAVEFGDVVHPCSQTVQIENQRPQHVDLKAGVHRWVTIDEVVVSDPYLTVRLGLRDDHMRAAIRRLTFVRKSEQAETDDSAL